jgi:hypothetical protein
VQRAIGERRAIPAAEHEGVNLDGLIRDAFGDQHPRAAGASRRERASKRRPSTSVSAIHKQKLSIIRVVSSGRCATTSIEHPNQKMISW